MRVNLKQVAGVALGCLVMVSNANVASAQRESPEMSVRTFPLRSLLATDAAKLVAPYVQSPLGGVFDVPGARAITVRERASVIATIDSVLRQFDPAPVVVRLTFQIIETTESAQKDPAIASVESALRGIFKFQGYRLLAESTILASALGNFSSTLASANDRFSLSGDVSRMTSGKDASVRLSVSLRPIVGAQKPAVPGAASDAAALQFLSAFSGGEIMSTGLTVPLNQTVVLGSGAPGVGDRVLILVVRTEAMAAAR
jgi:type II secretory pathway component GspD/PulD (secretin)